MALKKNLTKKEYEKLSESFQELYTENEDGSYSLDLEGDEDVSSLKRAKEHEVAKRKEEAKKRREAEAKLKEYEDSKAEQEEENDKKKGDIESLDKKWKEKYEKLEATKNGEVTSLKNKLSNLMVDSVANQLATEISTVPELLAPFLQKRLSLDLESDIPTTRVLDDKGELSALTLDELKTEFKGNPKYAAIMRAESKASGGTKATPPVAGGTDAKPQNVMQMSSDQLISLLDLELSED